MAGVVQGVDLSPIIDRQKIGAFHIKLIAIAFLVVMADGYDIGAAAFAAPALIREWHVAPEALGGMFSAGLQVRAEVEERDIAKIRADARVVVRADAFPDTGFDGRITTIAQGLTPTRLSARGPHRPNDTEALEVFVTLSGTPPLWPGMRVDVYFYSPEEGAAEGKP
jgi:hypothetical protein